MIRFVPSHLLLVSLALLLLGGGTAHAGAKLTGPAVLELQTNTEYRGHGLAPGKYHLMVRKRLTRRGTSYRCVAYLAAPRQASGSESFKGTLPSALQCTPVSGSGPTWRPRPPAGTYAAVACVARAGTQDRYHCHPGHSVATRRVRVRS